MDKASSVLRVLEEAAFSSGGFPSALDVAARMLNATTLALVNASDGIPAIVHSAGAEEMHRAYFTDGWHEVDIRHQAFVRAGPTRGSILSEETLLPDQVRRQSVFHQEFCRTFDIAHCVSWSYVSEGQPWGYSLLYSDKVGAPKGPDLAKLARLAPHAIRAGMLATSLRFVHAMGIAEGLSKASKPAIVLDHRGNCVFATADAELLFGDDFGIRGSKLWAADRDSNARLERLSEIARQPFRSVRSSSVVVKRRNLGRPLLLAPVPIAGNALDYWPSARLVIMIIDTSQPASISQEAVQKLFDFTPAEMRIAMALANGTSLPEIAKTFSVQISTVRQQIKSVLAKADVRRQSELVAILARIPKA